MKKLILTIAAAGCAAACCLGACSCKKGGSRYDNLNKMLSADYSQICLTVTNTIDEDTSLKSEYKMIYFASEIKVEYTVERFSSLSLGDPSTDLKTVLTGTAVIKDGEISGGEEVGLTASIAYPKFSFNGSYFNNADLTDSTLKADVSNPSAFLGVAVSCTDMKVSAQFSNVFYNIEVSYTKDGKKVENKYVFTK